MAISAESFVNIAGFSVSDLGFDRTKSLIAERLSNRRQLAVFFANAHFATICRPLQPRVSGRDDVLILNDGIGLNIASLICRGVPFKDNLNGTDFLPRFLTHLDRPVRLFLLGSRPPSVHGAAVAFDAIPNVTIVGWRDGFSFWQDEAGTIEEINALRPDILLVALGCPKQERWVIKNLSGLNVPLVFAVGALFDFVSKEIRRAPLLIRRLKLEWLYRLCREPRRLFHRYTIEFAHFMSLVVLDYWREKASMQKLRPVADATASDPLTRNNVHELPVDRDSERDDKRRKGPSSGITREVA